jgi:hypothetical protein
MLGVETDGRLEPDLLGIDKTNEGNGCAAGHRGKPRDAIKAPVRGATINVNAGERLKA